MDYGFIIGIVLCITEQIVIIIIIYIKSLISRVYEDTSSVD